MTTIYTTQRCLQVEEDYNLIRKALVVPKFDVLEFTEIITHASEFPNTETRTTKRRVLIQKRYIVEVVSHETNNQP